MKRRVASLPPISASLFAQRVSERKAETAVTSSLKDFTCDICSKVYATENAYRSHNQSKRHKEKESKSIGIQATAQDATLAPQVQKPSPNSQALPIPRDFNPPEIQDLSDGANFEVEVNQAIDEKIAAARSRLSPVQCLFCTQESTSLENNLTHMSLVHSFFIPDADYLIDIEGVINYLGEKIAVGNVCIFCNTKSREFRTLEAVRKHMIDKCHCKIGYESENDRLEISDYYDFTSSYADITKPTKHRDADNAAWEDVSDDGDEEDVDEVVDEAETDVSDSEDSLPDNQITYGDSHLELVLPSGARIGHRTLRRYYGQSFPGAIRSGKSEDPNSGAALVRRLLADKNAALVPCKGGFGAFGSGTQVVKARNKGEAREAGRHVREFRDQKRREDFKTKVGFIHNSQKHYRDPLLQ